jgi:AcrR family transcriptional regulator
MARDLKLRSGERREQILEHALGLFAQHGIGRVSTRRIAESVGISQPSLYAHFSSSDEIATELCCRGFARLHDRLALASATDGTVQQRFLRMGREYIRFGLDEPEVYRVAFMIDLPAHTDETPSRVLTAGIRAFGVLLALFQQSRGGPGAEAEAAAQSAWASLHGLVALLIARPQFPWSVRDMLIDLHLSNIGAAAFAPK